MDAVHISTLGQYGEDGYYVPAKVVSVVDP